MNSVDRPTGQPESTGSAVEQTPELNRGQPEIPAFTIEDRLSMQQSYENQRRNGERLLDDLRINQPDIAYQLTRLTSNLEPEVRDAVLRLACVTAETIATVRTRNGIQSPRVDHQAALEAAEDVLDDLGAMEGATFALMHRDQLHLANFVAETYLRESTEIKMRAAAEENLELAARRGIPGRVPDPRVFKLKSQTLLHLHRGAQIVYVAMSGRSPADLYPSAGE